MAQILIQLEYLPFFALSCHRFGVVDFPASMGSIALLAQSHVAAGEWVAAVQSMQLHLFLTSSLLLLQQGLGFDLGCCIFGGIGGCGQWVVSGEWRD